MPDPDPDPEPSLSAISALIWASVSWQTVATSMKISVQSRFWGLPFATAAKSLHSFIRCITTSVPFCTTALSSPYLNKWVASLENVSSHFAPYVVSNPPGYLRNLIRFFVVRMKEVCILGLLNAASEDSDQTVRKRRLIWIFASAHIWMYVFCCWGPIIDELYVWKNFS